MKKIIIKTLLLSIKINLIIALATYLIFCFISTTGGLAIEKEIMSKDEIIQQYKEYNLYNFPFNLVESLLWAFMVAIVGFTDGPSGPGFIFFFPFARFLIGIAIFSILSRYILKTQYFNKINKIVNFSLLIILFLNLIQPYLYLHYLKIIL